MRKIPMLLTKSHTFTPEEVEGLAALGYAIDEVPDRAPLPPGQASKYEVVVAHSIFKFNPLQEFTSLRMVHSIATGVEAMPVAELAARGIPLFKGKDLYSIPMAEWVMSSLLQVIKRSRIFDIYQKRHAWCSLNWESYDEMLGDLSGRRVLIVGTGDVASKLAHMLRAFEVSEIIGTNTTGRSVPGFDYCCTNSELSDLLPYCDIVVITCPLTETTRHLFDEKMLSRMPTHAILVNVSRGAVIDEAALVRALELGGLGWFIGDVFETEPLPADSPLWEMENVFITPHNSFITDMRPRRLYALIRRNLAAYAENRPMEAQVDPNKGY